MKLDVEGIIPACVAVLGPSGEIDEHGYRAYIRWLADQGPVALAVNADTGEGPHLWPEERERLIRIAVDEAGVPIVAGLAATFTAQAAVEAKRAEQAGAAGLLVFPIPAYQGLPLDPAVPVAYHEAIASAVPLPLIAFQLQPSLGGVIFSEDTLARIAAIESVVAIKEASFDARLYLATRRLVERLERPIALLTGNDNFIFESYVLGAEGALIGFGTLATRLQVEMHQSAKAGRWAEARAIWERIRPLEEVVYGAPVRDYRVRTKIALQALGVIQSVEMRPPLRAAQPDDAGRIKDALRSAGLL